MVGCLLVSVWSVNAYHSPKKNAFEVPHDPILIFELPSCFSGVWAEGVTGVLFQLK